MNNIVKFHYDQCLKVFVRTFSKKQHKSRGFTLIELLISLTILGMILALLISAIQLVSNSWDRTSKSMTDLEGIARAVNLLKRDINNIKRVVIKERGNLELIFIGRDNKLQFIVSEPSYPTLPGVYSINYIHKNIAAKEGLLRERALFERGVKEFPGATPANSVILLDNKTLSVFSYGAYINGRLKWFPEWSQKNRLPDLIKLKINNIKNGTAIVPPITIALHINAEQSCTLKDPKVCSGLTNGVVAAIRKPRRKNKQRRGRER